MVEYRFDREIAWGDALVVARQFIATLRENIALAVVPAAIGLAVGVFLAQRLPREFVAMVKIVPVTAQVGRGVASSLGLGPLLSEGTGQAITTQLFPDVLESIEFRIAVASSFVAQGSSGDSVALVEHLAGCVARQSADASCDADAVRDVRQLAEQFARGENTTSSLMKEPPIQLSAAAEGVLAALGKSMKVAQKGSIVELTATMSDSLLAAQVAQITTRILLETMRQFSERNANEQLKFLDGELEDARLRYDVTQRRLAAFADANRSSVTASSQIERKRLERDEALAFELLQRFSREREEVRIRRSDGSPEYTLLDRSRVPAMPVASSRTVLVLTCFTLGAALGLAGVAAVSLRRDGLAGFGAPS